MKLKDKYYDDYFPVETLKDWLNFKGGYSLEIWRNISFKHLRFRIKPKHRHKRSFICCRLPKIVGNMVVYRLFKATKWFKEPNIKYRLKGNHI